MDKRVPFALLGRGERFILPAGREFFWKGRWRKKGKKKIAVDEREDYDYNARGQSGTFLLLIDDVLVIRI